MELRNDYFNLYQTIISVGRGKRPNDFLVQKQTEDPNIICPFCPGNESETPSELGRIPQNDSWKVRWVLNKFPPFDESFGKNIIIIENPDHKKQLGDFTNGDFLELMRVYRNIATEFINQGYQYPFLFKNYGSQAGASRAHSHTQGAIYKELPPQLVALSAINNQNNGCKYCDIINDEQGGQRAVFKNSSAVAFCPIAPKFNNEIWILPLRHFITWNDFSEAELESFAEILLKILKIIHNQSWHYNFYFEFGTGAHPLHFNLKIMPRLNTWAAIEIATHNYIISISPEESARFYKEQIVMAK